MTQGGRGVEASSFAYGLRYLGRPGSFEIDPASLALTDREAVRGIELRPINNLPEFGGVRDAAPDAWGRRVIEARRRAPANSLPEAHYLFGSGPGAGGSRPKASVRDAAVLLIRRFDRFWHAGAALPPADAVLHETQPEAGAQERSLPFVSGLTLLGCDEFESRFKGYADLAHAVRRYVHPSHIRANNHELFARMVFNIFVSDDDDHLRNHGFVRDPHACGWRLSPLDDVVPRPGVAQERFLHLEVGAQGKLATLDNAMTGHAAFIPDRPDAVAAVRRSPA